MSTTTQTIAESIGLEHIETEKDSYGIHPLGGTFTAFSQSNRRDTGDHQIFVTSTVDASPLSHWIPEAIDEQTVAGYYNDGQHIQDIAEGPFLVVIEKVRQFMLDRLEGVA